MSKRRMPYSPEAVKKTRFTLVRHAESQWNATGRWLGIGDPPLSERGLEQAVRCAARFRDSGEGIDRLFCSDLLRTRETAAAIGACLGLTAEPTAVLRELAIGRWTGLTREEIAEREGPLLDEFESGDPNIRPGGGETRNEIRARVREAVERFSVAHAGEHLVLVVHAGVIRALVPEANPANTESVEITLKDIRDARPSVRYDLGTATILHGESLL
jgi:broad specificity phosphatase PhoE